MKLPNLILALLVFSCVVPQRTIAQEGAAADVRVESLSLFDAKRNRPVPVQIYAADRVTSAKLKPAIISHGYGGKNTAYGFIARHLARHGFYVASIQHEIPGDEPLPITGEPYVTRMPSWQRGVQNILFVLEELKRAKPELDYASLLLVGHSQGGDTSMLFARDHPDLVHTVISLDNRRMPFPRTARPRIFSIRSSDQRADDGVLPSPEEQAELGIKVVALPATRHDDMWDGASEEQKGEIIRLFDVLLRDKD